MTTNPSALDAVMVRERPILFSAPMVRAILAGTKTQTRRAVKWRGIDKGLNLQFSGLRAIQDRAGMWALESDTRTSRETRCDVTPCPYGVPGGRLWVRETFRIGEDLGAGWEPWMSTGDRFVICDAEPSSETYCVPEVYEVPRNAREVHNSEGTDEHWRSFGAIPSIFMPRWASRITLEITSVRVERLQAISEEDAGSEGVDYDPGEGGVFWVPGLGCYSDRAADSFRQLWESINGVESWGANPWVWIVEFQRITL